MYYIVLHCVAMCCDVLHCAALCCNVRALALVHSPCKSPGKCVECGAVWCSVVYCLVACFSVLQRVAVCCSMLKLVVVCDYTRIHTLYKLERENMSKLIYIYIYIHISIYIYIYKQINTHVYIYIYLWERISRTTSTTLPNRLRLGPKVPS